MELAEGLPDLTDLSLANNTLEGAIGRISPGGGTWQRFDLRSNALDYRSARKDARYVVRCRTCPNLCSASPLPAFTLPTAGGFLPAGR